MVRDGRQILSPGFGFTRQPEGSVHATPSTATHNVPLAGFPSGSEADSFRTMKPHSR